MRIKASFSLILTACDICSRAKKSQKGSGRSFFLSLDDVIDKELIWRVTTFVAGSLAELDARVGWYRFGYHSRFLYGNRKGAAQVRTVLATLPILAVGEKIYMSLYAVNTTLVAVY